MKNLPIQNLDFDGIKSDLKSFLKTNEKFKDFNFEGSNIAVIIDTLAYNAHLLGMYMHAILNESFIDSAQRRESLLAKAKVMSYLPGSKLASTADVQVKIKVDYNQEPKNRTLVLRSFSSFASRTTLNDSRLFWNIDDVLIYDRIDTGTDVEYTSKPITIYEGIKENYRFRVDNSILNQRFIIKDNTIDIRTIKVNVKQFENSSVFTEYKLAKNLNDIEPNTNVFYLSTNEDGFYEIFFGNDIFGSQPADTNILEVSYISTNSESGNFAKDFTYIQDDGDSNINSVGFYDDITTITVSESSGGQDEETIDDLKFSIPNHYKRQNRLVTESDFYSLLISEFRNIDSINLWGGEKAYRKDYGKTYISIKPKAADKLSDLAKHQIENVIKDQSVVGMEIVFVDPDFINLDLEIDVTADLNKTTKSLNEIEKIVYDTSMQYNETDLNKFNNGFLEVDLLSQIKTKLSPIVKQIKSERTVWKTLVFETHSSNEFIMFYGNELVPGTLYADNFTHGTEVGTIIDDNGILYLALVRNQTIRLKIGTVDYINGILSINLPDFVIGTFNYETVNEIYIYAKCKTQDVQSTLNNIIKINKVKVNMKYV